MSPIKDTKYRHLVLSQLTNAYSNVNETILINTIHRFCNEYEYQRFITEYELILHRNHIYLGTELLIKGIKYVTYAQTKMKIKNHYLYRSNPAVAILMTDELATLFKNYWSINGQ